MSTSSVLLLFFCFTLLFAFACCKLTYFTYACCPRPCFLTPLVRARVAMALAALSGDEQLVIFSQLCNALDPGVAVAFSSASSELWTLTQAPRQ